MAKKEKMFYTLDDLRNISQEELIELTTFGPKNEYFYSELISIEDQGDEFVILFRNGEKIYTQSTETVESTRIGKMRFDLIMKSAENAQHELDIQENFYTSIQSEISTSISKMESDMLLKLNEVTDHFKKSVDATNDEHKQTIKKIKGDSESALDLVESAAKKITAVDIAAFEEKMKKLDKILDAFGSLLEE